MQVLQLDRRVIFFLSCFNTLQWRHNGLDSVSNHLPHDFYLIVCSDADQRKHKSSASLAFVRGIHRWPVNPPHIWPVTRTCFHLMTSSWHHIRLGNFSDRPAYVIMMIADILHQPTTLLTRNLPQTITAGHIASVITYQRCRITVIKQTIQQSGEGSTTRWFICFFWRVRLLTM